MTGGQTKLNFNEAIEKKELLLKEDFKNNSISLTKVAVSQEEEKNHQEYLDLSLIHISEPTRPY